METLIVVLSLNVEARDQAKKSPHFEGLFTVSLTLAGLHLKLKYSSLLSRISKVFREFGAKLWTLSTPKITLYLINGTEINVYLN